MNIRKVSTIGICALLVAGCLSACGASTNNTSGTLVGEELTQEEANTIGTKLYAQFVTEVANSQDTDVIAEKLSQNAMFEELAMGFMPVEEGNLNGFEGEVKGFSKGTMFSPMIGTIPFVGYVFETDDADALVATLKEKAMLNWNICTVADEMVVKSNGNLVFFVMAPEAF